MPLRRIKALKRSAVRNLLTLFNSALLGCHLRTFPLLLLLPKYLFISWSRLWKVHQVNEEPTDQIPAVNNHGSWVCGQSQSPLFSQGVPDPGYLQPYRIAVSAHKSITLLYFLGSIKTNLSTQTHGVTVFSNPHPNL